MTSAPVLPGDQAESLALVLAGVRSSGGSTRPQLVQRLGLGRNVVSQRVADLIGFGLLAEGSPVQAPRGRPSRELSFRADAGCLLVAELGATDLQVGITDLQGRLCVQQVERLDIARGPEATLDRLEELFDALLQRRPAGGAEVWGVGVGLPGPVEFSRGVPIAPPIMPGWDGYPVRTRLAQRFGVPAWVDNDVNLMALGELRAGIGHGEQEMLYVKVGTGIGAGLVSTGRLHRGAQGSAGDIGHVSVADDDHVLCRCGNTGCLEALAGGYALARDGLAAAQAGRSVVLAEVLAASGEVGSRDVVRAAADGDPVSLALLSRSGRLVGRTLATLINFYNPSLIVVGGQVSSAGELYLDELRATARARATALASRDLRIESSPLGDSAGLLGAAFLVTDELFAADCLGRWLAAGSPVGRPELSNAS